jgi:hypothetical protein
MVISFSKPVSKLTPVPKHYNTKASRVLNPGNRLEFKQETGEFLVVRGKKCRVGRVELISVSQYLILVSFTFSGDSHELIRVYFLK